MFLKNKNIIFKIRRSKVTDYAALKHSSLRLVFVFLRQQKDNSGSSLLTGTADTWKW